MKAKTDDDINVQELTEAEIEIYQFPDCDSDEDDDFKEQNEKLKHSLPFALVGQYIYCICFYRPNLIGGGKHGS